MSDNSLPQGQESYPVAKKCDDTEKTGPEGPSGNMNGTERQPSGPDAVVDKSVQVEQPQTTQAAKPSTSSTSPLGPAANFNVFDWMLKDIQSQDIELAVAGLTELITSLSNAAPRKLNYTPEQGLQAHLIQQQLIAGIAIKDIEPMRGPRSRQKQVAYQRILRTYRNPGLIVGTANGAFVPLVGRAKYHGELQPLPIHSWYPDLPGGELRIDANEAGVNEVHASKTSRPPPGDQSAKSYDASLFADAEEQRIITNFYAHHFLNPELLHDQPQHVQYVDYGSDDGSNTDWSDEDGQSDED